MKSRKSRLYWQLLSACFVIFLLVFPALAEDDPNPDSPTPILISEAKSLRALAADADAAGRVNLSRVKSQAFLPNSKVTLYVTNIDLLPGEGADAFRLYVEDAQGRYYRFPVIGLEPLKGQEWVYAMTVLTRDELGFWEQQPTEGDVLVSVTWRGLASNRLKMGFGRTGGDIKDDANAVLTPFPTAPIRTPKESANPEYVGYLYSGDRIRMMEQATFGPTTAMDEQIRRQGLRVWLEQQFNASYPAIPYPEIPMMPANFPTDCDNDSTIPDVPATCFRDRYTMYPVQNWFFQEAFYDNNAQLRHRVAWALGQLWVISGNGMDTQQSSHMIEYNKLLSANAFGNYRTMMGQLTLSPAMGNYLDMVRSTKNSPNENYAREILQLFNVGLFMLNQNGTQQLDANNQPIPTYTQTTVNNFTKVFTGWGFCGTAASCPNLQPGILDYKDPMLLNQNNHNIEAKTLLSYTGAVNPTIAAGTNGTTELNQALDNIYNHPNIAPFVSRFLIQRLVTSDPAPAYVSRIAAVFNANRTNPSQMKEVVKAILLDPEARGNAKTAPGYGKLREPVLLATNVLRQFGVQAATAGSPSDGYISPTISSMGQNPFSPPTVFNYYPPDYVVPGPGINGPEFAILTTGTAIARANFMNTMVFSRINGGSVNAPNGTSINLTEMQSLATADTTSNLLVDTLNQRMMHGTMTAQNKATIITAVNAAPTTNPLLRAQTAIYLIATASQFQVQR